MILPPAFDLSRVTAENFAIRPWNPSGEIAPNRMLSQRDADGRALIAIARERNGETIALWADYGGIMLFLALSEAADPSFAARAIVTAVLSGDFPELPEGEGEPCGTCAGCLAEKARLRNAN